MCCDYYSRQSVFPPFKIIPLLIYDLIDFSEASLAELKIALAGEGFATYETSVGGAGFGLHIPSSAPDSETFKILSREDLAPWADGVGDWSFV